MANRLIDEQSPYLLQHAHNPVDWHPWGDEPFELARAFNKPVIVSIGYAACHWCHVMERESFENDEVAAFMNEHFICIKVDREEHPDVDHLYMDAVQAISGSGGWPLNVFVTPERIPFYGGTYYPPRPAFNRPSWMQLLERMQQIWQQQPDEVQHQAGQMVEYLRQASRTGTDAVAAAFDRESSKELADNLLQQADKVHGGFGRAPKFPGSMAISYLLEHHYFEQNEAALAHALHSLDAMISGGIYDQLGGGFARYATDDNWLIPHFEKMLYDNALLLITLSDALRLTGKARYRRVMEQTLDFVERELRHPEGGYYSSLDADSEGEEGRFYTWTWDEWLEALGGVNDPAVADFFGLKPEGNWEGVNILHRPRTLTEVSAEHGLSPEALAERVTAISHRLWDARQLRERPGTDDKCLLSWNALMNLALSRAAASLDHPGWMEQASVHMRWMLDSFQTEAGLMHTWKNGRARIMAKLEDYAFLIQALLQLSALSGDGGWLAEARRLTEHVVAHFGQEDEGVFFYFTSDQQQDIPVRKVDLYDGALPSANAVMAHNLLLLGWIADRQQWLERAGQMLERMAGTAVRYAYSFAYWGLLLGRQAAGLRVIACQGPEAKRLAGEAAAIFAPHCYVLSSEKEISEMQILHEKKNTGDSLIFVCTQQACMPPVRDISAMMPLIRP
jgi:uncharacterized protein YyaL (SSP411 family)